MASVAIRKENRAEPSERKRLQGGVLRATRKTGAVSGAPPQGLASSLSPWQRAAAPFGFLRTTRKTGAVSGAPPQGLASSLSPWQRAAAPFALITNLSVDLEPLIRLKF